LIVGIAERRRLDVRLIDGESEFAETEDMSSEGSRQLTNPSTYIIIGSSLRFLLENASHLFYLFRGRHTSLNSHKHILIHLLIANW
jgi:hypothetical protein